MKPDWDIVLRAIKESEVSLEKAGSTLFLLRILREKSLKKVADGAEISVRKLTYIEAGKEFPDEGLLLKLLEVLEVDLVHFLVALQEVNFIDELLAWHRSSQVLATATLVLGEGLTLPGANDDDDGGSGPN